MYYAISRASNHISIGENVDEYSVLKVFFKECYLQTKVFCLDKIKGLNLLGPTPQIADRAAIPQP